MTKWNREITLVLAAFTAVLIVVWVIQSSYLLSWLPVWVWVLSSAFFAGLWALVIWARFSSTVPK